MTLFVATNAVLPNEVGNGNAAGIPAAGRALIPPSGKMGRHRGVLAPASSQPDTRSDVGVLSQPVPGLELVSAYGIQDAMQD